MKQLDELCAEDAFKEALGRWLAGGAVIWNTWQKGFAGIRARYLETDPEAAGPVDIAFATWSQSVWCEVSESVLGPAWRDLLKVGKKVPRLPQSGAPEFEADATTDVQSWRNSGAAWRMEARFKGAARKRNKSLAGF